MKLSIVTIFDNNNVGNRLQNYGLQKVLMCYGTYIVTVKNKHWLDSAIRRFARASRIAENASLNQLLLRKKKALFLKFNSKFICTTSNCYWMNHLNKKSPVKEKANLYCAGSDQVWNPTIGRSGMFNYLGFAEKDRTFSYAASFGIDHIPEEYVEDVRKGLEHIKFISVREDAGKRIVEELTGRTDVYVHVDPTMLLTAEEWDKVSKRPKHRIPEKYILTYFLGDVSEERKTVLRNKADELGCELVELMDKNGPYYNNGPSEFLYLIKHAAMVCTDSFHGSVFSFLYERPFVIFDRAGNGENMSSRLETLCSKFGLEYCMARGDEIPELSMTPDYSEGFAVLETERKRSNDYFKMVFEEAERLGLCK